MAKGSQFDRFSRYQPSFGRRLDWDQGHARWITSFKQWWERKLTKHQVPWRPLFINQEDTTAIKTGTVRQLPASCASNPEHRSCTDALASNFHERG
jgi:hypothetical protein